MKKIIGEHNKALETKDGKDKCLPPNRDKSLDPDYEACIKEDSWTIEETAALFSKITTLGLKRLISKNPHIPKIEEIDIEWVQEAHDLSSKIREKIKKGIAGTKLKAEFVDAKYYITPKEAVKWAQEAKDVVVPVELLAVCSESDLVESQSCKFRKPPAHDTWKAKMKYVKEVALSRARKLLTKNPDTKPTDLMKDYEVMEAVKGCKFDKGKEPKLTTYQGWMTELYGISEFTSTLGRPTKKK